MKKFLLTLAIAAICTSVFGQGKIYCELVGTQIPFSKKVTVQVDFGQQSKLFSNNSLVDENGDAIVFNSMVDAMNYMGKLGWDFEQAYVVTMGSGGSAQNVYHWLLSKLVGEDGDPNSLVTKAMVNESKRKQQQQAQEPVAE